MRFLHQLVNDIINYFKLKKKIKEQKKKDPFIYR